MSANKQFCLKLRGFKDQTLLKQNFIEVKTKRKERVGVLRCGDPHMCMCVHISAPGID